MGFETTHFKNPVIVDKLAIFHLRGARRTALSPHPILNEDFDY